MMLDSLLSSTEFVQELQGLLVNAEAVVRRIFRRWQGEFHSSLTGETFQQRADDLADLGRKVLRHLEGEDADRVKNLPAGSVLVLQHLLPSDVVSLSRRAVAAIVVESLGQGSHAGILLAREKSLPTVADFPGVLERIGDGDEVLVDADRGEIVLAPGETRAEFHERLTQYQADAGPVQRRLPPTGAHARWRASEGRKAVSSVHTHDVELALDNGADGVGLFRLEQLYLARDSRRRKQNCSTNCVPSRLRCGTRRLPSGSSTSAATSPFRFCTFRQRRNPLLGKRGVRLLLEYPQLAQTQLAALLRLSHERQIRVLVPMVTLEEDIQAMRELFEETRHRARHVAASCLRRVMIETPAAALSVPAIAKHVDFLCVGTDDLTQYTLAAGRDNPTVNRYFLDNHSSLLRLLDIIVADAGETPLTLCGELAGREEMMPQLLAMEFRFVQCCSTFNSGCEGADPKPTHCSCRGVNRARQRMP